MARFSYKEADRYGGQGGGGFLRLANDKDTVQIRFLYNSVEDIEAMSVHQVEVGGKRRWVNCIREYNEPKDTCPFCAAGKPQFVKLFIPVYNIDEDKVQIWERGKTFIGKLTGLCSRFKNLPGHIFEVERNGAARDQKTTYELYPIEEDDTTLKDLPSVDTDILGGVVLDKSADDMEYYLEAEEFPPEDDEDEKPTRRRSTARRGREEEDDDDPPYDEDEVEERPRARRSSATKERSRSTERNGRRSGRSGNAF